MAAKDSLVTRSEMKQARREEALAFEQLRDSRFDPEALKTWIESSKKWTYVISEKPALTVPVMVEVEDELRRERALQTARAVEDLIAQSQEVPA